MICRIGFILTVLFCAISSYAQDFNRAIEKARFLIENHQKQTATPGIQIAVLVKDSVVWSEGFGYSDIENGKSVNPQTQFRIASVSKSLTSLALAKLMQDGRIDIDRPTSDYLPEFPEKEYQITSRQLASSTAGIRHYTDKDTKYNSTHYDNVFASLEKFQNDPLLFEPGTDYHYSSFGWVLLSAVMEKAAGQSFFKLMENTWSDLGMKNTTFDYPDKSPENLTKFYIYDKRVGRQKAPEDNRSYMYAGGGYLSTAEDLLKAGEAILQKKDFENKILDQLFQSQKLINGAETHYGLGWEVGLSRLNTPIVYHSGSMPSARSHFLIYPKEQVVFAYLANTGDHIFFNDREAQNIAELFVEAKRKTEPQDTNPEVMVGEWKISTTSLRDKKSDGTLELSVDENGMISGEVEFKRSRKTEQYPVAVTDFKNNQAHLVGVSPMLMDFYLDVNIDSFTGTWLHDFNVKGIPEEDVFWKPRVIEGKKL